MFKDNTPFKTSISEAKTEMVNESVQDIINLIDQLEEERFKFSFWKLITAPVNTVGIVMLRQIGEKLKSQMVELVLHLDEALAAKDFYFTNELIGDYNDFLREERDTIIEIIKVVWGDKDVNRLPETVFDSITYGGKI